MINYIEANCKLPPLEDKPCYDKESGLWELYFEESLPSWYIRGKDEFPDLITLYFETLDEAQDTLRETETIQTKRIKDEATEQNQELVLS